MNKKVYFLAVWFSSYKMCAKLMIGYIFCEKVVISLKIDVSLGMILSAQNIFRKNKKVRILEYQKVHFFVEKAHLQQCGILVNACPIAIC